MIDRQKVLAALSGAPADGLKLPDLVARLKIGGADKHRLRTTMDELTEAGSVQRGPGGRYRLVKPTSKTKVVPRRPMNRPTAPPALPGSDLEASPVPAADKPLPPPSVRKQKGKLRGLSFDADEGEAPRSAHSERKPAHHKPAHAERTTRPHQTVERSTRPHQTVERTTRPQPAMERSTRPQPVISAEAPVDEAPHKRAEGDPAQVIESRAPGAQGRIHVHPAGYGFVAREDGEGDVFVPARFRATAMDGDRVRLATWTGYKGTEGKVVEVLERGRAKLTGVVRQGPSGAFLEPDDPRISSVWGQVALDVPVTARTGQAVVAEITHYPDVGGGELAARIAHVLGEPGDLKTEIAKVIACADIPEEFPDDVAAAGKRTPTELRAEDFADRVDLRDRPFLTIDPETARDFDDAVCVEPRGTGFRVWVAVADVSHYVTPQSALDREARIRGCSVYLPDRAIPMLPHELSSGICSLNPEVDRCAMVVRLDISADGTIGDTAFCAAVIRSHARLDYPGVAAALAGDVRGPRARYAPWLEDLKRMMELSQKLRAKRMARGALDFDLEQPRVLLDEDDVKRVRDVVRSKADPEVKGAYQLVEEYMLAANEAVARFFRSHDADTMWRVHDVPSTERLETLAELLRGFGVAFEAEDGRSPKVLQGLMKDVHGKPYEKALNFLMLRSLKQAVYDVTPIGHFGLASTDYLHFTSPIRRYPDLIVHRLLKWYLRREGVPSGGARHLAPPSKEQLKEMAVECSAHERRAAEAEREVVDLYRAFLVRDRVGDELDGTVSAVTGFGLFVEIDAPYVDGLVRLEALGDEPFIFDERRLTLTGRRTGKIFRLGDRVRVRLDNVSVARRKIDLALVSGGEQGEVPAPGQEQRQARDRRSERRHDGKKRDEERRAHRQGKKEPRPDGQRKHGTETRQDKGGKRSEHRPGGKGKRGRR